jgi:nitrite reductase/ring-hydroxylating ferredoxin subunit
MFLPRALVLGLLFITVLSGCTEGRKRPPGYLRLGPIAEFLDEPRNLEDFDMIVRRDTGGLYGMSTQCTYDLSQLELRRVDGKLVLVSAYSTSTYDLDGRVLTGPATVNLPFYELQFEPKVVGEPRTTLFARVGREVAPSWRLPVTAEMTASQAPRLPVEPE